MPIKKSDIIKVNYEKALVSLFCGLTFFMALVFSNHTAGWGHIENFYYYYFVCFAWYFSHIVFLFLQKSGPSLRLNRIDGLFILYSGYMLINVPVIDGATAYHEAHFTMLHLLVLCFLFKTSLQKSADGFVPALLTLTGVVASGYGLWQWAGWAGSDSTYFTITGFFSNPGPYGNYLAAILPFALVFLMNVTSKDNQLKDWVLKHGLSVSLLVQLYRDTGQGTKAMELAKEIIITEPKVPSSLVTEIKNEMKNFYPMNHLLNTGYIAWTCLLLLIACHHKKTPIHDQEINQELKKVLAHYKASGETGKLKTAHFLIDHMKGLGGHEIQLFDAEGSPVTLELTSFKNEKELKGTIDSLNIFYKLNFIEDAKTITSEGLIRQIEQAFQAWE